MANTPSIISADSFISKEKLSAEILYNMHN
jgi:hypothetical protein